VVFAATGVGGALTPNPPYNEITTLTYLSFRSIQSPPGSGSRSTTIANASFRIIPTLANAGGVYRLLITHPVRSGSNQVSQDIVVDIAVTGGIMKDGAGNVVTSTTAWQRPGGNTWEIVGRLHLNSGVTTPTITFTAHGSYTDRFYADGFRLEYLPPCHLPAADAAGDNDVDQDDFAAFQLCYSGQAQAYVGESCHCFDRGPTVPDDDLDKDDVTEFEKCISGPAIPWSLSLAPSCQP
jgi:hypothetical protein